MIPTVVSLIMFRKRGSLFSLVFVGLVVAILVGSFPEKAPFWISVFGTPLEDYVHNIYDIYPYGWILFNLALLYVSFLMIWPITPFMFRIGRLSGRTLISCYQTIFSLATTICLLLLLISVLFCLLFSVLFGRFSVDHLAVVTFAQVLLLWFLGSVFCVWVSMIITMMMKNAFTGLTYKC